MESKKHEQSRLKDGGINSAKCRCGRYWTPEFIGGFAYIRICPGCFKKIKNCHCRKI